MRLLSITLLACLISFQALAQSTYYDAKDLRKILGDLVDDTSVTPPVKVFTFDYPAKTACDANPTDSVCRNYARLISILRKYAPQDIATDTDIEVLKHYRTTNPYFKNLRKTGTASSGFLTAASGIASKAISSVGGIDVTNFADGLAQFLVERTKEELNVAFFEKLKKLLGRYPEFKVLFPNTQLFLDSFESWQYSSLLNTLREAFDKDLQSILGNMIELRNLKPSDCTDDKDNLCKSRVAELGAFMRTNEGVILLSALQLGNTFQQTQSISQSLNAISDSSFLLAYQVPSDPIATRDFHNSVKLLNIFSMSLASNQNSRQYITKAEFQALQRDPLLLKIFVGLIYEQVKTENIVFGANNISVAQILERLSNVVAYLEIVHAKGEELQVSIETLNKHRTEGKATPQDYIVVFDAGDAVLRAVANFQIIDPTIPTPPKLVELLEITGSVSQIAHDISSKNYHAAIIALLKLIDDRLKAQGTANAAVDDFKSAFLNYASFGANVVRSESPEEVKKAIKAMALPAGSSSIKKTTDFNIALNAYVGFVWGQDRPSKGKYMTTDTNGNPVEVKLNGGKALAVYAPVGVTFSKGMLFSKKNPWSVSAFISLIDVGALVGYRFDDDSTSTVNTEVKLANIFAPGGNVAIGLPWVPISIGYGFQFIPSLQRNPSDNQLYKVDYSGWRMNQIFISVDIPLVNFYTGKKYMFSKRKK